MNRVLLFVVSAMVLQSACVKSNPVAPRNDPMEDPNLFEGDIMGISKEDRGVLNPASKIWTNGIVYYIIDSGVYTDAQLQNIYAGMKIIEDRTRINGRNCITFTQRTTQTNYVRVTSGSGCSSYLGMTGGQQTLSLAAGGCTYPGTTAHEFMHALGFWHEQARADRDNYVTVYLANIAPASAFNFDKQPNGDYLGFPYDYYSILHYDNNAFSTNGQPTIVAKQAGVTLLHSSKKSTITDTDVGEIRKRYNCV
jgi:hypothetical protein